MEKLNKFTKFFVPSLPNNDAWTSIWNIGLNNSIVFFIPSIICDSYPSTYIRTKKNGQGVETWPNGYIYKGEFKNSEWSGIGVLTFPDGSTYEGEWAKGFMNGKGTFTSSDGTEKSGIWKNGKLQE